MKRLLAWFSFGAALAQPPVAPTTEPVGRVRGQDWSNYNIVQSWEVGVRWRTVDGNLGKYRSDINFGNGLRLLGSSFSMHSKDGHGRFFDELTLSTQGLGNDPYGSTILRLQKNQLFRYDLRWWRNDYFNPALPIAGGLQALDTRRRFQDHDLTLFPQGNFKLFLGYSRNKQEGPGLSTVQLFDSRGDEFPLFRDVRRERNEYRLGGEVRLLGFRLNAFRGWDNFKEDTPFGAFTPSLGANPTDTTQLTGFRRAEPYHGNSPYWRVALFREGEGLYALNGRFSYTEGRRNFVLDETAIGTGRFGAAQNRQILALGNARRPVATGNLNLTLFPGRRVTVTNHTAYYSLRMEGDSRYQELDNRSLSFSVLPFQYLGIRTAANATDLNIRITEKAAVFAGYHYSDRRIASIQDAQVPGFPEPRPASFEQTNRLHSGVAGLRLRPWKRFSLQFDGEVGRADRPFYPVSEKNYHALGGRADYRTRTLRLSAWMRTNYNFNSASLTAFSARSRQYAADASWNPGSNFGFDAGYAKLHADTAGGIAYFADRALESGQSIFISNLHTGYITARARVARRVDLLGGYTRIQDTGDGRATPAASRLGPDRAAFRAAQTFPLAFDAPLARVSLRLHERLRFNVGYQYFRYREDFSRLQNYRAHTGYTSLLWSF